MSIGDIIKKAIEITDHQPFLFIGSGISKRYLNTEKWDELLKHFCNEISDNEFLFECYKNTVGFDGEYGVLPSVASLIEKDYNQNALTLDKYKEFSKAEQLYEDIVLDNQLFNPDLVVDEYLPELLKHNSGGLPMFKYLADYSKSLYGRVKANILKYLHLSDFLNDSLIKQKNSYHKQYSDLCIEKVIEIEGVELAYRKLILLEAEEIDCGKLSDYLKSLLLKNTSKCLKGNSELKRLIRIYDFLKYKNASANLSNSANT